jgi:hypothetical protein
MMIRSHSLRARLLRGAPVSGLLFVSLVLGGCVGIDWRRALETDTPAAYYRFLRDHPDSKFADRAQERLDFHQLQRRPSLSGFDAFRSRYPESELIAALRPTLEEPAFAVARARGTAEAYRNFVAAFAGGEQEKRAEGNAVFLESQGFGGDPQRLAEFASAHPESDFAAEAERTAEAVASRQTQRFDRVGLVVDVPPTLPEARRVRQALTDRIEDLARIAGVEMILLPDSLEPLGVDHHPSARLEVRHREQQVDTRIRDGAVARPARVAQTDVVLREGPSGAVISSRRFELRVEDKSHVPNTSVLFSAAAPRYWDAFFVPVARWRNDQAIRPPIALESPVVGVDGVGDRVVVLYENGGFDVVGLEDPARPTTLATYRRNEDFKKWSGVRVLGSRVAIYGEEGLELVRIGPEGMVAEATWPRGEIGRVLSIAPLGDALVVTGAKGMQLLDPVSGTFRPVMRRVALSVASIGEVLVFVDGESIFVADLERLSRNRVIAQLNLGKTFGPERVRIVDRAAIVTGPGGALVIDLADPLAPRALAKLSTREVGAVFDATRIGGRVFLVGERGLQLLSRSLDRVEETIDVGRRRLVSVMGRHLVTASGESLQVVDATPWTELSMPAAPSPPEPGPTADGADL